MTKILHVCETAIGGVATYLNLLSKIPKKTAEQIYLVPSSHSQSVTQKSCVLEYKSEKRSIKSVAQMIISLLKFRRQERPNVYFFHSSFALLALLTLRIIDRRAYAIYCAHGWAVSRYKENSLKGIFARIIEGRLCGLADVVVNISQTDADTAKRLGYGGNHVTIENAVREPIPDARNDLFTTKKRTINILFVGRLDHQKGLDILLTAFERAIQSRPDLRLHIIGSKVRDDGKPISLPPSAKITDWVDSDRIDDWYRSADLLVVPSRWEGFGLVVPEAFRNGTPAIVSDRGALPTLIQPGFDGWIFNLDNESLYETLINLNLKELRLMRKNAKSTYDNRFRPDRFRQEILEIYKMKSQ